MDTANSDRPERRSALVCRELARFNIDVAALNETKLADEGNIQETAAEDTIFWIGKTTDEPRIHGVGFAIKTRLVEQFNLAPTEINERLMTLRILLKRSKYLTLISVYAPTLTSDDETKDSFYDDLHRSIRPVPKNDKLVLLGDFNARFGRDHLLWDGLIGKHGHGNCNANGRLLLGLCTEHDLTVTNTLFRLTLRQKTTWRHPRSKNWHTLDYVLTRKRDIKDVCITRSMPDADDCWTDHRLLLSRLRMNIRVPPRHPISSRLQRRFDCHKLKDPMWISRFQEVATAHLDTCPPSSVNENWISLRDALTTAAVETIGFSKRKKQHWFAENEATITSIIEAKSKARLDMESHATCGNMLKFRKASRTCQKVLRKIQNAWWRKRSKRFKLTPTKGTCDASTPQRKRSTVPLDRQLITSRM